MRLSVFGMGYVGNVSAACFAADGHHVIGVDPNETKVGLINDARSPIVEPGLAELIEEGVRAGRLRAVTDPAEAVRHTELSMVCVGTPSQANGNLDLQYLVRVCEEIGACLKDKDDFHIVVIRSTMLPGTIRETVQPVLERASGKKAGQGFGLCNNPEFLREGSAVRDFREPPKTVIGESDDRAGAALAGLYAHLDAPLIRTEIEVAEMVKYADNAWHAVKVTFGNEIGAISKRLGIDSHRVMDIFCQDTKLNISPYYLKPGFAFGGSCLPKDLRAITYKARELDLPVHMLNAVLPSNRWQVETGVDMILSKGRRKVGVLGFSFKANTDDLRESPLVEVIERLLGKGMDLKLYDRNVSLARLTGGNRDYIMKAIPHISNLMVDSVEEVIDHAEVLVIGNGDPAFRQVPDRMKDGQVLVDFVRVMDAKSEPGRYDGVAW
ncbi:nucleotide sugar dehydrogenase [Minwuia thermotolerans]|uniref:UDP-glucose 6-dehydrogenase n=1 Tax=Minwuia thermotolerans TaxID=2056226 RepID=A0A2M9FZY2_9PROT|nr:nucleotide sugar dehydrogenase [Minwuia thermotolerans]PJK28999.1 GDP-mannose dehydrogenase [Minwuia thermotolerans]